MRPNEEVGQEWHEATDEVSQCNGQGADEGTRTRGFLDGVMEIHEEGGEVRG